MKLNKIAAILATTALGLPGLVHAEANVTIYGLIDLNLSYEKAGNQKYTGVASSELNGSRIGFKGTEDLGNGLKALFVLETGFDPDTGATGQGGRQFGRQSFVGLEGRWGKVMLGRQYSPAFDALDPFEATGGADRTAGLLHRKTGSVARGYETRFDNMIKYRSPSFGGFSAEVGYWTGAENTGPDEDTRKQGRGYGVTGLYKNGPFAAAVTTQTYYTNSTGGQASTHGIAGAYDFTVAKAYLLYSQDRESGSQGTGKAHSYALGAEIPVSAAGTLAISYGARDESNEAGAEDASGWSLYYMHSLSKRTTLYTAFSHISNKGNANYAWSTTPAAGDDPSVVMAGIRHRF
ncbi:porin [Denitromonas ohlonensis]|uniref:Porin n=2 Tax=Denitromonas TaxID=139331 RepID=A0A558CQV9_9RHOO|nr:porin [Denitromonas ohlonensis]TVO68377.1 porin [Denitromonas ohlonensis]TVO74655.1 porin [Denitromonas ohlonensis]TVT51052.1 MAG: porin [Denitromonas halophila]TVT67413.1 MAG: porin [Denitromonas halophila]